MLKIVESEKEDQSLPLDELIRQGAQRLLLAAVEAEVEEYIQRHRSEVDGEGHRLVVRNGQAKGRKILTGAGELKITAPRVNDKRVLNGERQRFTSQLLPPYMRKSPKMAEVLPVLYLRGLSTNDFKPALEALVGKEAAGLSASTITRLTAQWEKEHEVWSKRDLSDRKYVYVWVDGIHMNIRLEEDRLCLLVVMGALADGTKELIAVEDGYRESKESWASVLRSLRNRGMPAPVVAVGDGALGFWAASRDVWPETIEQRCWFHKLGNVLDKLPKRLQPKAKRILRAIMNADTKSEAEEEIATFREEFELKHLRSVTCLEKDQDALLAFFDFPAQHWLHLRTTNPIESTFATVRLRQRVTKGAGKRSRGLAMAFKLMHMAQQRWRRLNGYRLLSLVAEGIKFPDGIQPECTEQDAA